MARGVYQTEACERYFWEEPAPSLWKFKLQISIARVGTGASSIAIDNDGCSRFERQICLLVSRHGTEERATKQQIPHTQISFTFPRTKFHHQTIELIKFTVCSTHRSRLAAQGVPAGVLAYDDRGIPPRIPIRSQLELKVMWSLKSRPPRPPAMRMMMMPLDNERNSICCFLHNSRAPKQNWGNI